MIRLLAVLLVLAACDSATVEPRDLPFEVVAEGHFANATEPIVVVARTDAEFDAVANERLGGVRLSAPDFDSEMAVFVFHGPSRSGRTSARVDRVVASGSEIRVDAVGLTPCVTTDDTGSPWAVAVTPLANGDGALSLGAETGPCGQ